MWLFARHLGVVLFLALKVPWLDLPEPRQLLSPRFAQLDLPAREDMGGNMQVAWHAEEQDEIILKVHPLRLLDSL